MRLTRILIMVSAIMLLFVGSSMAQENLDDWTPSDFSWGDEGSVFTATPMGTSAQISASGVPGGGIWGAVSKMFPGSLGMLATFNVSELSGYGSVGIRKGVGVLPNGNYIMAGVYLSQDSDGQKAISYGVRERNDSGTVQYLARGVLGGYDGTWSIDEDVLVAFLLVDNEIWFASSKTSVFVKVQLFEPLTQDDFNFQIDAQANEGSSLEATVSDVIILQ
jgi:hypothetical protein